MRSSKSVLFVLALIAVVASHAAALELTTTTDKAVYYPYEPVIVSLSAYASSGPVYLWWPNSCIGGYVLDGMMYPPPGGMCFQVIMEVTIPAGETHTWPFTHRDRLDVGTHSVFAHAYDLYGPTVQFDVVDPAPVTGDLYIDFETIPGPASIPEGETRSLAAYKAWGVHFGRVGPYGVAMSAFGTNHYAGPSGRTAYPPGANLTADFDMDLYLVKVLVAGGTGATVTMTAFDDGGNAIGSVTSGPVTARTFDQRLIISSEAPIARLEWWPSRQNAWVHIDDLKLVTSPGLPGDADDDGDVDLDDFVIMKSPSIPEPPHAADFDGDGDVDLDDFMILKTYFGVVTFPDPAPDP